MGTGKKDLKTRIQNGNRERSLEDKESEGWSSKHSAQEHSNGSESGADGCPSGKTASAQGLSSGSESADGCPPGNAGRMGVASAQGHSNGSESGAASSQTSQSDKASARRFAKMSRKERRRLLKNRREAQ